MSMHEGHRQRMKNRFLEEGLDHFSEVQVLETLLFYAIPRKDTNPIAHELLDRFGSLAQVLDASAEELQKVPGMTASAAVLLKLITETGRYYLVNRTTNVKVLPSIQKCAEYMLPFFYGRKLETVFLLCLDAKCKVLCCREIGEGSINSAGISIRKIVEVALASGATTAVLGHNHPSGIAIPSLEDKMVTRQIAMALQAVEVNLADHIIVADGDYVSLAETDSKFNSGILIG